MRLPLFVLSLFVAECGFAKQPNILFIMTDNQGWSSLSCYGNKLVEIPIATRSGL